MKQTNKHKLFLTFLLLLFLFSLGGDERRRLFRVSSFNDTFVAVYLYALSTFIKA